MTTHQRPDSVVILDLDDTIIPDQDAFRSAATTVLQAHLPGLDPSLDPVTELLQHARRRWLRNPLRATVKALGVSSWEALWSDLDHPDPTTTPAPTAHAITVWGDTLTALGADPHQARSAALTLTSQRESLVHPYPGAHTVIEQLAADNRLWLATHGSSSLQRRKLHLAGLESYFEFAFISAETGFLKDQTEFAEAIKRQAQESGTHIRAVVGDSNSDLQLAAHLERPAIHICHHRPCEAGGPGVQHERALAEWMLLPD
jgi:FMN phosphatase YigB (HAD superfamily)